jgi:hypothetical protein
MHQGTKATVTPSFQRDANLVYSSHHKPGNFATFASLQDAAMEPSTSSIPASKAVQLVINRPLHIHLQ